MKHKKQKGGFLGMLLGTLGASLLGNLWTGKGTIWVDKNLITNIYRYKHMIQ